MKSKIERSAAWLVYGTGAVAGQILEAAASAKRTVRIAGDQEQKVRHLAQRFDVRGDVMTLRAGVSLPPGVTGVVNTAGPFSQSAAELMDSCIEHSAHYVDVSNEFDSHIQGWNRAEQATQRGVALISGAGFGTFMTERLIAAMTQRLHDVEGIEVFLLPSGSSAKTVGVRSSEAAVISTRGMVVRDGRLVRVSQRLRTRKLPSIVGAPSGISVSNGDLVALSRSTSLSSVDIVAAVHARRALLRAALPLRSLSARINLGRSPARTDANSSPIETATKPARNYRVRLVAVATSKRGERLVGRLSSVSGTSVAAHTALLTMRVLDAGDAGGTYTVGQILGDRRLDDNHEPLIELFSPRA